MGPAEEDVAGLDIPVDHLQAVDKVHGVTDLTEALQDRRLFKGHPALGSILGASQQTFRPDSV